MSVKFRAGWMSVLCGRGVGVFVDSGFYDGGRFVYVQIGRRVYGLWFS